MSKKQFKVGDVVTLKSSGPSMTLAKQIYIADGEQCWQCHWFDVNNNLQDAIFRFYELKKSKDMFGKDKSK